MDMHIAIVPNRNSTPCVLLRESYREGKKVRKRTLANLTHWPPEVVEGLRAVLKGGKILGQGDDFEIVRSLPHGHVVAVLKTLHKVGLAKIIASRRSRQRDLVVAMIVARIIDPRSKLATARGLSDETAFTSLGETLGVADADEDDLYKAMDWLLPRQDRIEQALANKHLRNGTLVLYDVTSSYFEGRSCPLAHLGHNRDGKRGKLQIVYGLLCDVDGRPVAVEVFEGDTGDPATLAAQIRKIRSRFGIERVVLVGDRGMITEARITDTVHDALGAATAITKHLTSTATAVGTFDYDNAGRMITQKVNYAGSNWAETLYLYDKAAAVTRMTDPLSHNTDTLYDEVGRTTRTTDDDGHYTVQFYDGFGNVTRGISANSGNTVLAESHVIYYDTLLGVVSKTIALASPGTRAATTSTCCTTI